METEDHKHTDEAGPMPTAHERLECRRALVRRAIPAPDAEEAWSRFTASHPLPHTEKIPDGGSHATVTMTRMPTALRLMAAACVAVAVVALAAYLYGTQESGKLVCEATHEQRQVTVTDEKGNERVVEKDETVVFRAKTVTAKAIKTVTVKTSRGKDCHLTLPDGTQVWLNQESTLQFPETFTGKTRDVQLTGEAYFDVAKDSRRPMVVSSQFFTAVVLGTAFNMDVSSAASANIVLVRGTVAVSKDPVTDMPAASTRAFTMLSPGQQAKVDGGVISVTDTDTYPFTQWKDGLFYFDSRPLAEIMRGIGRWYDVNVVFEDTSLMDIRLHFVADRNSTLDDVISDLNRIRSAAVTIKDGTVTVAKAE